MRWRRINARLDQFSGRITLPQRKIPLAPPVEITQADVRELQLAKGAIAAGLEILLNQAGLRKTDLKKIVLAGLLEIILT
jgi:uncharacterized 2Fe-2S/4Fe-4S cluster protein (DUF4445 family)